MQLLARSPVSVANSLVSIEQACRWAGVEIPDFGAGSVKVHCPFEDVYHTDPEPAFRIYPESNHAWCFACSQYYSPVGLCAAVWDMTRADAAHRMLELAHYAPPSLAERWAELTAPRPELGLSDYALALRAHCAQVSARLGLDWDAIQYDPAVSERLSGALGLLSLVRDASDGEKWLSGCQEIMSEFLARRGKEACHARLGDSAA
jgi:hypothetical protein